MTAPLNPRRSRTGGDIRPRKPPYKLAGLALTVILAAGLVLVYLQFRGDLTPKTRLTLTASRSGLVMDRGSKVTYNGVEIGRVAGVEEIHDGGTPNVKMLVDVNPRYLKSIPANVDAQIKSTTVFGNKYVSFTSPKNPSKQRISSKDAIPVTGVTTEFNTLFETVVSISEKVDPIKLNKTLTATAQALDGLGDRFGQSITHGNEILADVDPQMPQIRYDTEKLVDLGEVYAAASPDLWEALKSAVITARTFNDQQLNLDTALMASIGVSNTGADLLGRGGPFLARGADDLIPTSQLLNYYSPEIFCTFRNYAKVAPKVYEVFGGNNGYSLRAAGTLFGAGNPFVYPDNLPRINAHGGPEGKPGCWQTITHDLWPAPYLVMDTGYSLAPYNHIALGQPALVDYVWGRQFGEYTINP
jgi:phospholipid/cholesterol/gamma-HCH transport system substrate-binding protein